MRLSSFVYILIFAHSLFGKQHPGIQYLFPLPGSEFHPRETVLILRFEGVSPVEITNLNSFVEVRGERSEHVPGTMTVSTDGRTMIFSPEQSYTPGEWIDVRLAPIRSGDRNPFLEIEYGFGIDSHASMDLNMKKRGSRNRNPLRAVKASDGSDPLVLNGVSIPSELSRTIVTIYDDPAPGLIFRNAWSGYTYSLILDNEGNPVWYWPYTEDQVNLKVQPDDRLTVMTWDDEGGKVIAWDSTYTMVHEYRAPPGYTMDDHEFIALPNGHAWFIIQDARIVDMSHRVPGGHQSAEVVGNHIVELDADGNPVFIWRCWDYFEIEDAVHEGLDKEFIDYVHMNALDFDLDGHILASSRHLSEITKINRTTGDIIWRLGGENDYFTWMNDEHRISYQHAIMSTTEGNYTIFDNGNFHDPRFSRSLEVVLDTVNWIANKIWEFRETPDIYCDSKCNTQRLPNGHTLNNWSATEFNKINEVRPDGTKALEMHVANGSSTYRAFKFLWNGKARIPFLVAEPYFDRITLLFNKFGDPDMDHYNVYGGQSPRPEEILATATQPFIHLTDLENDTDYFFRVTAVDSEGVESDFSNEVEVYVNIGPPGANMVSNGDFSEGIRHWSLKVNDANATWDIVNGEFNIKIFDGGSQPSYVQATHENLHIGNGNDYLFEFDAYAEENRVFQAEVTKSSVPYTSYSKIGYTYLTTGKQRFSYSFMMEEPSDLNARVAFSAGGSDHDVFIDNVSVKQVISNVNDDVLSPPSEFSLEKNYPNPFNSATTIAFSIPELSHVKFTVYNVRGVLVEEIVDLTYRMGTHRISFNASALNSGIYLYAVDAQTVNGRNTYRSVKKMMVLK